MVGEAAQKALTSMMVEAVVAFSCHKIGEATFRDKIRGYNKYTTNAPLDVNEIVNAVKRFIKP